MSDQRLQVQIGDPNDDGSGCLMFFGIIIVSICVGTLYSEIYGWLTLGVGFIACSILGRIAR